MQKLENTNSKNRKQEQLNLFAKQGHAVSACPCFMAFSTNNHRAMSLRVNVLAKGSLVQREAIFAGFPAVVLSMRMVIIR